MRELVLRVIEIFIVFGGLFGRFRLDVFSRCFWVRKSINSLLEIYLLNVGCDLFIRWRGINAVDYFLARPFF